MTLTTPETPSYQLISDLKTLEGLSTQWMSEELLAIDTEFIRTDTLFAQPGLIQIADSQGVYLIDPVSIQDLSSLIPVLENTQSIKVMHSMSEDVSLLYHSVGAKISRVFDTQVAAALLGISASPGYQILVKHVLTIELDKGETRSDWLQRPLTDSQLHYAALDVIYLLKLFAALRPQLQEKQFYDAVFEETEHACSQVYEAWERPELAYLKLRGGWEYTKAQQQLLQAMVIWRDKKAYEEDVPKPWVFNDETLVELIKIKPKNFFQLKLAKSLKSKRYRKYADAMVELMLHFQPSEDPDFQLIDAPIRGKELILYKQLKTVVAAVSKETGLPNQLLGSRKMLEALVIHCFRHKHSTFTQEYSGWRSALLGEKFTKLLFANPNS